MSDSRQVHQAVQTALKRLYPEEPRGNLARHLNTLASLITGIVLSKSSQLPKIAAKVPGQIQDDSQTKQFSRWAQNEWITAGLYFLPFVLPLLTVLARQRPLVFIMDGSVVGRGCVALMVSLLYHQRALPIAWAVVEGKKGHFPEDTHVALIQQVHALVPPEATVVFLGDGEFDGTGLQAAIEGFDWHYVCRTAKNIQIQAQGQELSLADLGVQAGGRVFRKGVLFTEDAYGPVMVIARWEKGYAEPIYLVSNMTSVQEACKWYRRRMTIETFFSDQKSRGFQLDKSHLSDPERLAHLMIATGLAYVWVIYLGVQALEQRWRKRIHRVSRCDLSLFQLGLRLLDHLLENELKLSVAFTLKAESVR
jgi:hypothetical protein